MKGFMAIKTNTLTCLFLNAAVLLTMSPIVLHAAEGDQVTLATDTAIPGSTLPAGSYTFQVEDRLSDRAIVKVLAADGTQKAILLAAPNSSMKKQGSNSLVVVREDNGTSAAQGYICGTCSEALEFVYPKADAVALATKTKQPFLAMDPESDKISHSGADLTSDDMKVVTLWLLTPTRVAPGSEEVKIGAAHYAAPPTSVAAATTAPAATSTVAATTTPSADPAPAAPARVHHKRLPSTASNEPLWALLGTSSLLLALLCRLVVTLQTRRLSNISAA